MRKAKYRYVRVQICYECDAQAQLFSDDGLCPACCENLWEKQLGRLADQEITRKIEHIARRQSKGEE